MSNPLVSLCFFKNIGEHETSKDRLQTLYTPTNYSSIDDCGSPLRVRSSG